MPVNAVIAASAKNPPTVVLPPPLAANVSVPANSSTASTRGTVGWSFTSTRLDLDQENHLLLVQGELINDTGSAQQLASVSGAFYNDQGQLMAESSYNASPIEVVPPGRRVPFELAVYAHQEAASYDLWASSSPSSYTPGQNFELLNVNEQNNGETHCLTGLLKSQSGGLKDYVVIVVTWYDDQDQVVKFKNHYETNVTELNDNQPQEFSLCTEAPVGQIARNELQTWGH
jgi:hypothetical protein